MSNDNRSPENRVGRAAERHEGCSFARLSGLPGVAEPAAIIDSMPIYEYRCSNGHQFEVFQAMSDDPVSACTECGAPVERVFHPVAVHFKGSGFYTTDYARKGAAKAAGDGGGSDSGDSKDSKDSTRAPTTPTTPRTPRTPSRPPPRPRRTTEPTTG